MEKFGLEKVGNNEWMFVWPRDSEKASDLFFDALEYADMGNLKKARQLLEKAIKIFPQHIDAINHLGMMSSGKKSKELNEQAFNIGFELVSKQLNDKSKLEWGWTENRPFLRACHTKGLILLDEGKLNDAIKLFNQMIGWNYNDNQGIRDILADIYSTNDLNEEMIELAEKYSEAYSPSMNFGLALALFRKGENEKANLKMKKAIENFPLCAKILLEDNPKKPKFDNPGYITVGGDDQAYDFWECQGKVWKDSKIRDWLKSII